MDAQSYEQFRESGYLIIPDFVSQAECQALIERAEQLTGTFVTDGPLSRFTTDETRRSTDAYFLASARDVAFFFEDETVIDGQLTLPPADACNKIGHALHDFDPIFSAFSRNPDLERVAKAVGLVDPLLIQSMFIFKNPRVGGRVDWHQDATFLYTDPITVKGFWFALEDADRENGCLWVAPGGHLQGVRRRFIRGEEGQTSFIPPEAAPLELPSPVPLEVPAGTLVVFDGCLPHFSAANRSAKRRCAYTLHLIESSAHYPDDNWLQDTAQRPFRGFSRDRAG